MQLKTRPPFPFGLVAITATAALFTGYQLGKGEKGFSFPWQYNGLTASLLRTPFLYSGTPNLVSSVPAELPKDKSLEPNELDRARNIVSSFGVHGPKSEPLYRLAYAGVFDRRTRNVHWVAEKLTKESIDKLLLADSSDESPDRKHSTFKEDPSIPQEFRVKPQDYTHSGYDRGHLVPAADVVESQKAIDETFFMTNMSPQTPAFNRGVWASFERYVRGLVKSFDEVYVVTGPMYLPKLDESDGKYYVKYEVIGRDKNIAVPTHFYKVILGVKNGKHYLGSFVLANEGVSQDTSLDSFLMPVAAIEKSTGLEFFPFLDKRGVGNLCSVVKCSFKLASKFRQSSTSSEE
ncbi:UNVERIFIED_CONTAM: nuclease [Siphonaria sp. JEL0065]|nr:nuclease [Siphonaria sp. JEL0065]